MKFIEYTVKVDENGSKEWLQNGKRHREDGPACEWADGTKYWYKEGQYHREDGPAIEYKDGTKEWYLNGKLHREDGPAVIYNTGSEYWYLNGAKYSRNEFFEKTSAASFTNKVIRIDGKAYKLIQI